MIRTWGYGTSDEQSSSNYAVYQFEFITVFLIVEWTEVASGGGELGGAVISRAFHDEYRTRRSLPSYSELLEFVESVDQKLKEVGESVGTNVSCGFGVALIAETAGAYYCRGRVKLHRIRGGRLLQLGAGLLPALQAADVFVLSVDVGQYSILLDQDWMMPHRAIRNWIFLHRDSGISYSAAIAILMAMSPEFIPSTSPPNIDQLKSELKAGRSLRGGPVSVLLQDGVVPNWGRGNLFQDEEVEHEELEFVPKEEEEEEEEEEVHWFKAFLRNLENSLVSLEGYLKTPSGRRSILIATMIAVVVLLMVASLSSFIQEEETEGDVAMLQPEFLPGVDEAESLAAPEPVVESGRSSADTSPSQDSSASADADADDGGEEAGADGESGGGLTVKADPGEVADDLGTTSIGLREMLVLGAFAVAVVGLLYYFRVRRMKTKDGFSEVREQRISAAMRSADCPSFTVAADGRSGIGISNNGRHLIWAVGGRDHRSPDGSRVLDVGPATTVKIALPKLLRTTVKIDYEIVARKKGGYKAARVRDLTLVFCTLDKRRPVHTMKLLDKPVKVGSEEHVKAVAQARYWEGFSYAANPDYPPSEDWEQPVDLDFGPMAM